MFGVGGVTIIRDWVCDFLVSGRLVYVLLGRVVTANALLGCWGGWVVRKVGIIWFIFRVLIFKKVVKMTVYWSLCDISRNSAHFFVVCDDRTQDNIWKGTPTEHSDTEITPTYKD